jgi:hypothetical protein
VVSTTLTDIARRYTGDGRTSRRGETALVVCMDVEPDPRRVDRSNPPPWEGFERSAREMQALRERLGDATGKRVVYTWFLRMDPQIELTWGSAGWAAEAHGDLLAERMAAGDELAVHPHVWRWDDDADEWFVDFEDPAWAEHCLTLSLDTFEEAFGRACTAHRGGDRFLSSAMLAVLEKRGVKIDLTVEPGLPPLQARSDETVRGWSPDYRRVPTNPYRSSAERFPAADPNATAGPAIVPLISAPRLRPPFRRLPLYLWEPPRRLTQRLALERLWKRPQVAAFAARTDLVLYPEFWEKLVENIERVAQQRSMVFRTASEAA